MDSLSFPRPTDRRRRAVPAVLAVLAVLVLYLLPLAGQPLMTNPNELVRLELAVALAEAGTVDLEGPAHVYGLSEDVARQHGRILADKAPGLSLAAVPVVWLAAPLLPRAPGASLPAYWPLRHLATGLLVAVGTIAGAALIARRVGTTDGADWRPLFVLAALATPLWTYGTVFFGHAPAAALVAVAWLLLVGTGSDEPPRGLRAAVGGLAAGFAVVTEYPTAILLGVIVVTLVVRRTPARHLLLTGAAIVVSLVPGAIYHQIAFGAPWLTGYAFKADVGFADIHSTGLSGVAWPTANALWGVLGSASRGLFFYSPVLLLAPVGLAVMVRRRGWREAAPTIVATLAYVAFAAGFVDWRAGWCAAARHLVPVVPLLLVPTLVAAVAAARRPGFAMVVAALAAVSVARTLLTVVLTPFFPPEFDRPLTQLVIPSLSDGAAAPTLVGALAVPAAAVWAAVGVGLLATVAWAAARLAPDASRWSAGVASVALVVQLAWFTVAAGTVEPGLEKLRLRVLAGLGQPAAATVTGAGTPDPSPVTTEPG